MTATTTPKLTKQERDTIVSRVVAKEASNKLYSSVCEACSKPLNSNEFSIKGWLSHQPLYVCHGCSLHINNVYLIDFSEELGYND